jgi:hypothetical protein
VTTINTQTPINFLSPINFRFEIFRAPNVNFFIQKINLPGLNLPPIDVNNPLIRVPYAGEHLMYDELQIQYKVDENLQNYLEIFNWLKQIGKQTNQLYQQISGNSLVSGLGLTSDISVQVLTSKRNPNYEVVLNGCFPISISSLNFDASAENINYLEATARFRYISYDINKVS